MTEWYERIIPPIRELDRGRIIIVDAPNQTMIDPLNLNHFNIARSIHSYFFPANHIEIPPEKVIKSGDPFVVTEIGVSERAPLNDLFLANSILGLFLGFVGEYNILYNTTFGYWKMDAYDDTFNLQNLGNYPQTRRVIGLIRDKIESLF